MSTSNQVDQSIRDNPGLLLRLPQPILPIPGGLEKDERLPQETEPEFQARMLWKCLVAITSRDCSIMLTMQRINVDQWDGRESRWVQTKSEVGQFFWLTRILTNHSSEFSAIPGYRFCRMPDKIFYFGLELWIWSRSLWIEYRNRPRRYFLPESIFLERFPTIVKSIFSDVCSWIS